MKVKKKRIQNVKRVKKPIKKQGQSLRHIIYIACISISTVVLLTIAFWGWNQLYVWQSRAATQGFVDNNRSVLNSSSFFTAHEYSDCSDTADNFWATEPLDIDCFIDEPQDPPSAFDEMIAKDPPGLYYKHFLPTDWYITLPDILLNLNIDISNLSMAALDTDLQNSVAANPAEYANISVDSLLVGVEGGVNGTVIGATSLMVHPQLERPIANNIGLLKRAQNIYKPYIEEATGANISDADLLTLYTDALNKCGENGLNNDNSGRGAYRIIGSYAVIVQGGDPSQADPFNPNDCDIHVVKLNSSITPAPSVVAIPSSVCLGSCPTVSPAATPTNAPITVPTMVPLPTTSPAPTGNTGGVGGLLQLFQGFIGQISSLFTLLLGFLSGL